MKQMLLKVVMTLAAVGVSMAAYADSDATEDSGYHMTESGLKIFDQALGSGAIAKSGHLVTVHYVGALEDGKQFDSSRARGQPFTFRLGAGQVIQGWEEGVQGMKVGGKRKLVIPSYLGYGERGIGPIPGNATLVFEVELIKIA